MPQEIARQWFIPGDGIDRHVISADIQRYLGNDATVRPGKGTGDNQGVSGYWIKAYRNLTSAMISDLRADSARWRKEQAQSGTRGSHSPTTSDMSGSTGPDVFIEPYVGSRTYDTGNASRAERRGGDSPAVVEAPYGVPSTSRSGRSQVDAMQIDPPMQPDRRYGQPGQPSRNYQPEGGQFPPPQERSRYGDGGRPSPYQQDQPMADDYPSRAAVSQSYAPDPRYQPGYGQPNDGAPPGYVRQGDYYVPVTSSYGQPSVMAPSRPEPPQYPPGPYGQAPPQQSRGDPRDPRYAGGPEYNDPSRYYPSPATTAASVGSREPISSPPQQSPYGNVPPQLDQYGRAVQNPQVYGAPEPGYQQPREPTYGRDSRQPAPPASGRDGRQPAPPSGSDRDRDARRRRLH